MLQKFWSWLTNVDVAELKKRHPDLSPIDVDKIAKELNLVGDAKRFGEAGLPTSDAKALCGPEAAIIQRVEKIRQDYADWAVLRLNILSENMSRHNVTKEINGARQMDQEFERKAAAIMTEKDTLLRELGASAVQSQREINEFKKLHHLSRDARPPPFAASFLAYAIVLLLMIIEAILNANFFAQGLDTGWLGGFTQALTLAAVNVIIAFIMGKFIVRYVHHIKLELKMIGWVGLGFSLILLVLIGSGIAHYRDSLTSGSLEPAKVALATFSNHPFELKDFFSWVLFFVSIFFGLFALFDGLLSDDSYPGYGTMWRRAQTAKEDFEDELQILRKDLDELRDDYLNSLEKIVKGAQVSVTTFQGFIDDKEVAKLRLSTALRDADHSLEALLRKFRTENQLHRKEVRRPDYFDTIPPPLPIQLANFNTDPDKELLSQQRRLVETLLGDEQNIRARIQAAYNRQFNQLQPLDMHFPIKGAV